MPYASTADVSTDAHSNSCPDNCIPDSYTDGSTDRNTADGNTDRTAVIHTDNWPDRLANARTNSTTIFCTHR